MQIGVVGAGWWGANIISTLRQFPDVERILVYDADPAAPDRLGNLEKVRVAPDLETLRDDRAVEAVCVATPPRTHYTLSRELLAAGKHVLVEKPPAMSAAEVEELGSLARERGSVYMLDALYLFLEPVGMLRRLLGEIPRGEIRHVQVYRIGDELRRPGSGMERIRRSMFDNGTDVVEDLLFHDAALLVHLFGALRLRGVERQHLYHPALADTARIRLDAGSVPVEVTLSWTLTGRRRGMSVYLSDGIIEFDALAARDQIRVHTLSTNAGTAHSFDAAPPLKPMLRYFLDASRNGGEGMLDAEFMKQIITLWEAVRNA